MKNYTVHSQLDHPARLTGGCLCGGVRYSIDGVVRGVVNCFCGQCQKTSGHYVAATRVDKASFMLEQDQTLRWFTSSPGIQRGFCRRCGGNLFWENDQRPQISIMAGTLDKPTGLKTVENIFVEDASDYFDIPVVDKE